jgi:ACS family allantoate permease-like MFS transporter
MLLLRFTIIRENKRRDKLQQSSIDLQEGRMDHLELSDITDRKNLNFRYVY